MNHRLKLIGLTVIAFLLAQPMYGQRLLKSLREKAEERIERKLEEKANEKIDEKIDESFDKIEDALEKEKKAENDGKNGNTQPGQSEERGMRMLKNLGISGEPIPISDRYEFDHLVRMNVESFDKSGKKTSEGEFITHLNPGSKSMAYQVVSGDMANPGQGLFIVDAEKGATIILSNEDGKKTGIVYGIGGFMESLGESYEEDLDLSETPETYLTNPNVSKTGKTKRIAGYSCEEYIYSDEETKSEIWITRDLKMNTRDFFSTLFKTSMMTHGMGWGYMMEATSVDKQTGEKSFMQVTEVDDNSNVDFSMADYQITNFGNISIPQK